MAFSFWVLRMLLPDKLFEQSLYWGPLFVGVIFLIGGLSFMQSEFVRSLHQHVEAARLARIPAERRPAPPLKTKLKDQTVIELKRKRRQGSPDLARLDKPTTETPPLVETPTPQKDAAQEKIKARLAARKSQASEGGLQLGQQGVLLPFAALAGGGAAQRFQQRSRMQQTAAHLGRRGQLGGHGLDTALLDGQLLFRRRLASELAAESGHRGAFYLHELQDGIEVTAAQPLVLSMKAMSNGLGLAGVQGYEGALFGGQTGFGFARRSSAHDFGLKKGLAGGGALHKALQNGALMGQRLKVYTAAQGLVADPVILMEGIELSQAHGRTMILWQQGERFGVLMTRPHVSYVALALKGLESGADRFALQQQSERSEPALDTALPFALSGSEPDFQDKPCAEKFYRVVKLLYEKNVTHLNTTLKTLFKADKQLPGRWVFSPGTQRGKRSCLKWRVYHSGRRKCRKWGKRQTVSGAFLSKDEATLFQTANQLVRARGVSSDMKRKSGNGWVLTRVAQDLRLYTRQPPHPAICTGAPRMVGHFEKHLGRVKKMIEQQNALMSRMQFQLEARRRYVEGLLTRAAELARIALEMRYLETEMAAVDLGGGDRGHGQLVHPPAVSNVSIARFDEKSLKDGTAALAQVLWGDEAASNIAAAEDTLKALNQAVKAYKSQPTRIELDANTRLEVKRLFSLIEASYYVKLRYDLLKKLSIQLFGTLSGIKEGHRMYCNCQ